MRKWKQICTFALAAVLTAAAPAGLSYASPEFARTGDEWARLRDNTMEYEELAGLIHEYNVTVLNNQREYNENKDKSKTSEERAQDLRDAAAEIRSNMLDEDPDSMQYASQVMANAMNEISAQNLEKQADNNLDDREIMKWGYDQVEATLVSTARSNMIAYHQKQMELEMKQKNKEQLEAAHRAAAARLSVGKATQLDVLTAQENIQNAEADILKAEADLKNIKQKLCVMLGWKYDAEPDIRELPTAYKEQIDAIDLEADKAAALENNYTLKMNQKKLKNAVSNSDKESLQLTIDDNKQKIAANIEADYKAVLQARTSYEQAEAALALEERNMQAAEVKRQIGKISDFDYLTQQNAYFQKQGECKIADMNLFQAMETYRQAVDGLATAT